MRSLFYQQSRGTLCLCIKTTHFHDIKCKSQSSAHGLMMSAQYCWPRGFSCLTKVKNKSICIESEHICPGSHPRICGNQVGVPKLYMFLAKSLTQVNSLQDCHSFCLEIIMIKFHLIISSINLRGQLEICYLPLTASISVSPATGH